MNFSTLSSHLKLSSCSCDTTFTLETISFRNKSQQFSSDLKSLSCNYKWEFIVSFDQFCFQIGLKRTDENNHTVHIILHIKMKKCDQYYGQPTNAYQKYDLCLMKGQNEIFSNKIQRNILPNEMLVGTITLFCDCQTSFDFIKLKEEHKTHKNIIQLQNDVYKLLEKKDLSDIVLKVGDSRLPAHKLILSMRSPVFRKMFENNMTENKNSCVDITDTEEHIMNNFLVFLYRGTLEDTTYETVYALYTTADKYDVPSLVDTCRMYLDSYISLTTVLNILELANLHDDKPLKEKCSNFICENFEQIELNPEWNSILDKNPRLASYVLRNLSSKFSKLKK